MKEFEASQERLFIIAENLKLWEDAKKQQEKEGFEMPYVYNNYFGNFKNAKDFGLGTDYRQLATEQNYSDKKFGSGAESSQKAKTVSYGEFFQDFDLALENSGAKKEIDAILNEFKECDPKDKIVLLERLQKAFKPVYIELRLMGYNHQDIIQ
jgi:hypothetical protein